MGFVLPESELRQLFEDLDGAVGPAKPPQWVSRAIGQGQVFRRDYSGIRVPVLALMNDVETTEELIAATGYQPKGHRRAGADRSLHGAESNRVRALHDQAHGARSGATIKKYPLAGHYLFLTREADVLRELHVFVAALDAGRPPPAVDAAP